MTATRANRNPLADYTSTELTYGSSHGLAYAPEFAVSMNLLRLEKAGWKLSLHPDPRFVQLVTDSGNPYATGLEACNCPGFSFNRTCRHVQALWAVTAPSTRDEWRMQLLRAAIERAAKENEG